MTKIPFTKMHGAGNDYIYVDAAHWPIDDPASAAIKWSAYHTGIGSDGLILIDRSEVADFRMRMYNNDGSEGLMCGNGVRCIGKYVYDHRMTDHKTITIETKAGIKTLKLYTDDNNLVTGATVDMGKPILADPSQLATPDGQLRNGEIEAGGRKWRGTFVSMGNPHFVIFVDDIKAIDVAADGRSLEMSPMFPQRCNIEFVEPRSATRLRTRVWERGSGITMACGTGACATLVAATLCGRSPGKATIAMDGGDLDIEWNKNDDHIYMTGPATTVFEGQIEL